MENRNLRAVYCLYNPDVMYGMKLSAVFFRKEILANAAKRTERDLLLVRYGMSAKCVQCDRGRTCRDSNTRFPFRKQNILSNIFI